MVHFNVTKFCYIAGTSAGVNDLYRRTLLVTFTATTFIVFVTNMSALIGILRNYTQFFNRGKVFVVTLLIIDFVCGCTFLSLFVVELSKRRMTAECDISSWRVIFFIYCLTTRILCMFFISFQGYVKTCRQTTSLEYWFDKHTSLINIVCVWTPGIVGVTTVGASDIKTDKILGCIMFVYFVFLIMCNIACYAMILKSVKSARRRNNADIYSAALYYIKMILVWFLVTNIPLAVCGFILLLYAFFPEQQSRDQWVIQPVYVACMAITALNIIINPIFFIQKFQDVRDSICCTCSSNKELAKSRTVSTETKCWKEQLQVIAEKKEIQLVQLGSFHANDYMWC